jgi:TrmH family RNA methyltransferase
MQHMRGNALELLRAARGNSSLAVLAGFHAVKHAVRFDAELLAVAAADPAEVEALAAQLAPDVADALRPRLQRVDPAALDELVRPPATGRVVAVARRPADRVADLLARPAGSKPVVLLEAPRHLGNVGACVRVAAAAGAEALATTGEADPWHPAAIRGAAGLQFALPVARLASLGGVARPLVAVDPDGEPLRPELVPAGAVLAFGSERRGLSAALRARAVATVALPMRPGVSSLNLAAAVAAVLYALRLST